MLAPATVHAQRKFRDLNEELMSPFKGMTPEVSSRNAWSKLNDPLYNRRLSCGPSGGFGQK